MHDFKSDFYGHDLKAVVLGYIRPELDYISRGETIQSFKDEQAFKNPSMCCRGSH